MIRIVLGVVICWTDGGWKALDEGPQADIDVTESTDETSVLGVVM
jgi:hypothetical protein